MKILFVVILFFSILSSAAPAEPDKIIGENSLRFIKEDKTNVPFKYRNLLDAIGYMDMGCTITHIGRGYAVTAGHCFWTGLFGPIPNFELKNQPCEDDFAQTYGIWWSWRSATGDETAQPKYKSLCEEIIYAKVDEHTDVAIIKVSNPPTQAVAIDLSVDPIQLSGKAINIFSHADNSPLQTAGTCKVKKMLFPTVSTKSVLYVCDTLPGSSGAAIIDAASLKIIGLHAGGVYYDEIKDELPADYFDSNDLKLGINYGTYMTEPDFRMILKGLGF